MAMTAALSALESGSTSSTCFLAGIGELLLEKKSLLAHGVVTRSSIAKRTTSGISKDASIEKPAWTSAAWASASK